MHFASISSQITKYILHPHYLIGFLDTAKYYLELALIALAILFTIVLTSKLIRLIRHLREPFLFLEITPPSDTKISSVSTKELFNLVLELLEQRTLLDKIMLRDISASFEIISTKENGIRYLIRVPKTHVSSLERVIRSYLPGSQVRLSKKDLLAEHKSSTTRIIEFKQAKHFSLPLGEHSQLEKHDPINYLTGMMNSLKTDDILAIQVVAKPLNQSSSIGLKSEFARIKKTLHYNKSLELTQYNSWFYAASVFVRVLESVMSIVMIPFLFVAEFITGHETKFPSSSSAQSKPTPISQEHSALAKSKLSEPLFATSIRALILTGKADLSERERGIKSSFASLKHACGQSLVSNSNVFEKLFQTLKLWKFNRRIGGNLVLSSSEVGLLYHFPNIEDAYSEDLQKIRSRELPAPLSFKKSLPEFDIVIGANNYNGKDVPIGLTLEQRRKHTYVIGKTGTGKTTLLKSAIYQDMLNNKGLAVLDPHGDMFRELLELVPKNRLNDVIVFDPSDRNWPIGLNILSPGIPFENKDEEDEWITGSVLSIFAKITAKEYWGPRMEHILRNTTLTALQTENPSLYTLQRLLTDKSYQKKTAATLDDPVLKQFWNKEFALLGKMQLSSVVSPLTQRLGHFITSKMSRHILLQEKSTISISQIMNEGKILLVNLAKGDLGEDQSFFFGAVLTSLVWMAAYQRTKIPERDRRDFFLYVDEFQDFATPRFSEITSEGRKFRVALTASHQNIAQVDDKSILKIVAGNANNIICLKASPDEETFILPFMAPEVEKGDIVNLAPYHFYMKAANEASENAFSGVTVPLNILPDAEIGNSVLKNSREQYATPRDTVAQYLDELLGNKVKVVKKPSESKPKKIQPKLLIDTAIKRARKSI